MTEQMINLGSLKLNRNNQVYRRSIKLLLALPYLHHKMKNKDLNICKLR